MDIGRMLGRGSSSGSSTDGRGGTKVGWQGPPRARAAGGNLGNLGKDRFTL